MKRIRDIKCQQTLRDRTLTLFLILVLVLMITSCQDKDTTRRHTPRGHVVDMRKPMAWGNDQKIYVFADMDVWQSVEAPLKESLERYYFTTENETYFDVELVEFKDFSSFYRFKNLLFLAHLDSEREVSKYVKSRLESNAINSVDNDGIGLFARNNLWANEQYVVFMLGSNKENLVQYSSLEANTLFQMYKNKLYSYIERGIYNRQIYSSSFFRDLPWGMKIPEIYAVHKRKPNENFVSFLARRKDYPDRYIGVYYENMLENNVDLEWAINTRAKIAWDHYDEDEFSERDVRSRKINFADFEAIKIAGRWQNQKYFIGGAFRSFAFYDDDTRTAWLIDNSVFYPEGYKLPALIEMEIISRTIEIDKLSDPDI